MELVEGPSLAELLAGGPINAARTMGIVAQVAATLLAAHSAGLIHRDIKPANILFTPGDTVRITDFGIAHAVGSAPLTATGMLMGTPGLVGFQRRADATNFLRACRRAAGLATRGAVVRVGDREVRAAAFPISVDAGALEEIARRESVRKRTADPFLACRRPGLRRPARTFSIQHGQGRVLAAAVSPVHARSA